jgi:class 3 adenylate cyclase
MFEGIEGFISGLSSDPSAAPSSRVVSTVLFSDIVGSTEQQREVGDDAWTLERQTFEANAQAIIQRSRGRVVQFTGDGVMAAFDVLARS